MSNFIKDFDTKKLALYVLSQVTFRSTCLEDVRFLGEVSILQESNVTEIGKLDALVDLLNAAYQEIVSNTNEIKEGIQPPFRTSKNGVEVLLSASPEAIFPRQKLMLALDSIQNKMNLQALHTKISNLTASLQDVMLPEAYSSPIIKQVQLQISHNFNTLMCIISNTNVMVNKFITTCAILEYDIAFKYLCIIDLPQLSGHISGQLLAA